MRLQLLRQCSHGSAEHGPCTGSAALFSKACDTPCHVAGNATGKAGLPCARQLADLFSVCTLITYATHRCRCIPRGGAAHSARQVNQAAQSQLEAWRRLSAPATTSSSSACRCGTWQYRCSSRRQPTSSTGEFTGCSRCSFRRQQGTGAAAAGGRAAAAVCCTRVWAGGLLAVEASPGWQAGVWLCVWESLQSCTSTYKTLYFECRNFSAVTQSEAKLHACIGCKLRPIHVHEFVHEQHVCM